MLLPDQFTWRNMFHHIFRNLELSSLVCSDRSWNTIEPKCSIIERPWIQSNSNYVLLVHPHMKSHFKFVQNLNLMRKIVPFAILDKFCFLYASKSTWRQQFTRMAQSVWVTHKQLLYSNTSTHNSEALTQLVTKHEKVRDKCLGDLKTCLCSISWFLSETLTSQPSLSPLL